jgi:hypothetical protein
LSCGVVVLRLTAVAVPCSEIRRENGKGRGWFERATDYFDRHHRDNFFAENRDRRTQAVFLRQLEFKLLFRIQTDVTIVFN